MDQCDQDVAVGRLNINGSKEVQRYLVAIAICSSAKLRSIAESMKRFFSSDGGRRFIASCATCFGFHYNLSTGTVNNT